MGEAAERVERCELCVVGSGIAGLNAVAVASRYLSPRDRVILVDRRGSVGGMWTDAYGYVRLHQPHPFFTAADIPWTLNKPRNYLATRDEVLGHFRHCVDTLAGRVHLEELHGYEYVSHREVRANGSHEAHVTFTDVSGAPPLRVEARRCIRAFGNNVTTNAPLELSSNRVKSVSPDFDDILGEEMQKSDSPVYVVGGGKTGMDTAHALIRRFPGRRINLLIGRGTVFACRDRLFPTGLRRWIGGTTTLEGFLDLARHFDGDNEDEVLAYFHRHYGIALRGDCRNYMFGLLSRNEQETISKGTHEIIRDYLSDVVDDGDTTVMQLRSGETRRVEPGSWVVNCTGYIFRDRHPYQPYVSEHGAVVSVDLTSAIAMLSTIGSYLLTHLTFLGKLDLPLYELDMFEVRDKARSALPWIAATHMMHNVATIAGSTPRYVMEECGVDMDRWYPMPRRLVALIDMQRHSRQDAAHRRRTLDRVREKYGLRCGPLSSIG